MLVTCVGEGNSAPDCTACACRLAARFCL
jgi:hypothetical protein